MVQHFSLYIGQMNIEKSQSMVSEYSKTCHQRTCHKWPLCHEWPFLLPKRIFLYIKPVTRDHLANMTMEKVWSDHKANNRDFGVFWVLGLSGISQSTFDERPPVLRDCFELHLGQSFKTDFTVTGRDWWTDVIGCYWSTAWIDPLSQISSPTTLQQHLQVGWSFLLISDFNLSQYTCTVKSGIDLEISKPWQVIWHTHYI